MENLQQIFFHLRWKNICWRWKKICWIFPLFFHFFSYFFLKRHIIFRKKPEIWKKYSVSIFIHVTVFSKMFPHLIWHFQSYLGRKKGTSETFLSLGLFISRPQPAASASKIRPRLQKTFLWFPTWEKLKSDVDKFFLRVGSTIIRTKYYSFIFRPLKIT